MDLVRQTALAPEIGLTSADQAALVAYTARWRTTFVTTPDADVQAEARRLSDNYLNSGPARQAQLQARYRAADGPAYTRALENVLPRLEGMPRQAVYDALAERSGSAGRVREDRGAVPGVAAGGGEPRPGPVVRMGNRRAQGRKKLKKCPRAARPREYRKPRKPSGNVPRSRRPRNFEAGASGSDATGPRPTQGDTP